MILRPLFQWRPYRGEGILATVVKQRAGYQVNTHENLAFGLAVAHLMMALNFIKLDNMPWDLIFNTAKMPNKEERDMFMQLVETDKGC